MAITPQPRARRRPPRSRIAKTDDLARSPTADEGAELQRTLARLARGLPFAEVERLRRDSGLPLEAVAGLIRLPPRTLARRKARGRLDPGESERLFRVATVFGQAVTLFCGQLHDANRWLRTAQRGLGGLIPLELLGSEVGARAVADLIGRLEHGVFT